MMMSAAEHQALPEADRIAVDSRDHRLLHFRQRLVRADDAIEDLPRAFWVVVAAERLRLLVFVGAWRGHELAVLLAGQDDDAHLLVVAQLAERESDLPAEVERAAAIDAVGQVEHADGGDLVLYLDAEAAELAVVHDFLPFSRLKRRQC